MDGKRSIAKRRIWRDWSDGQTLRGRHAEELKGKTAEKIADMITCNAITQSKIFSAWKEGGRADAYIACVKPTRHNMAYRGRWASSR